MSSPLSALDQRRQALRQRGVRPGLDTMQQVLRALASPHLTFPSVLIGGTNGKGSTASLVASMAQAADYRVGLFTSPHLQHFEEQIRLDSESIPVPKLLQHWDRVVATADDVCPGALTVFEALTASAMLFFAEQDVELAVCEVGMGGLLDSTNVLQPHVSAVTSLGLDHISLLGTNLAEIANHKAGIFRAGRPALIAQCETIEGEQLLEAEAQRLNAMPRRLRHDCCISDNQQSQDGAQRLTLQTPQDTYDLQLSLAGRHQHFNVVTAVGIAEELRQQGWDRLNNEAIRRGVACCRWPGRLEKLRIGERIVLLDAAHNGPGAAALASYLRDLDVPFEVLFGALADKDAHRMLACLEAGTRLWLTWPTSERAWDPVAFRSAHPQKQIMEDPLQLPQALDRALVEGSGWLVVTGSLHLVGDVRTLLFDHYDPQPCTGRMP